MKKIFFLAVIAIFIGAMAQSCCPQSCESQPLYDQTELVADAQTTLDAIAAVDAAVDAAAELPPVKYGELTLIAQDGSLRVYHLQYEDMEFILSCYTGAGAGGIVQLE